MHKGGWNPYFVHMGKCSQGTIGETRLLPMPKANAIAPPVVFAIQVVSGSCCLIRIHINQVNREVPTDRLRLNAGISLKIAALESDVDC